MAPKKKGAKGKKAKDAWSGDELDSGDLNSKIASGFQSSDDEPTPAALPAKKKSNAFAFAALEAAGLPSDEEDDGEDDLMAQIAKAAQPTKESAKADKKKKKKQQMDDELDEFGELAGSTPADDPSKAPVEMTAEELLDAEFGADDGKKKGKKGKKATRPTPAEEGSQATGSQAASDAEDEKRPLSKKEKEKLKKQKQKEKEKAAKAAAQKSGPKPEQSEPAPEAASEPAPDQADEAEEGDDATSSSKNKKKKKKAGAAKEEAAPAAAAKGKGAKVPKHIQAMRDALLAKQAAEAAQAAAEEAERKRIEEEERKEREEQERLEAARLAKKEKQKEKERAAKAAGTWKSAAQKKEEARQAAQRQALIASGVVKIAGLEGDTAPAPKRPVYSKKKVPKRTGPKETVVLIDPASKPAEPETPSAPASTKAQSQAGDDIKDDWDAPSEKEDVKDDWDAPSDKEDVKDDWDAPSEKEDDKPAAKPVSAPAKSAPAPVTKPAAPATKPATHAPTAAPAPGQTQQPRQPAKAVPSSSEEESSDEEDSSEEDSSEEDSSDDDDSDDSDDSDSEDEHVSAMKQLELKRKAEAAERKRKRVEAARAAQSKDDLRSPICCILGHVDTGKTKILDKIRQTNVQEGEAGGITQQIGATFFPVEAIRAKTEILGDANLSEYKIPGLLVIDTPGHESFTNLRSRGSSLCNIAILVVDIVHGLEPQTLESLRLLRDKKTPFIVALNKIDRCYGWKPIPNAGFQQTIESQARSTRTEFEERLKKTIVEFAEQGLNALPYYENKDMGRTVSLVPTSAVTGEGIPDLLMLVTKLTQERLSGNLMYLSECECTVLEVKVIEGLGTTIDVVLTNGILREGDKIVVCGLNGPIVTQVRALLTPQPMKEMRIKGAYVHHKEVKASLGVKIVAPDLEKAIAGSRMLLVTEDDDEEELKKEVMQDLTSLLGSVDRTGKGVWVQSSTLGALEALLDFLKVSKIPVAGINIGPVHKKDVMRASVMLERAPEFAVCLCFDVPVDKDAEKMAEDLGIKMFKADIIYHLFDAFTAHNKAVTEARQRDQAPSAVWPCKLKTLACFAKRDPIILGCDLIEGSSIRIGTPLCVVKKDEQGRKEIVSLGKITSLEINHKPQTKVTKSSIGAGVAIKIERAVYETAKMFGRHFDDKDEIVSMISRNSIDVLKNVFRDEVPKEDWQLIVKLKKELDIS